MKNKIYSILLSVLIIMSILSGCGKEKGSIAEDMQELEKTSGDSTEFTSDNQVGERDYNFNVEIHPGVIYEVKNLKMIGNSGKKAAVYDVSDYELTDADIKAYADRLFDNGEYIYTPSYSVCDTDTLLSEKSYFESLLNSMNPEEIDSNGRIYSSIAIIDECINTDNRNIQTKEEGKFLYDRPLYGEDGPYDFIKNGTARGFINGELWIMNYCVTNDNKEYGDFNSNEIEFHKLADDYNVGYKHMDFELFGNNQSDITKCKSNAEDMLRKFGINYYSEIYEMQIERSADNSNFYMNGYNLVYSPWNDAISHAYNGLEAAYISKLGDDHSGNMDALAIQPYILIDATDDSVERIIIKNIMGVRSVMTDDAELLSEDQIIELFQQYLKDEYSSYTNSGTIEDTRLELHYLLVPCDTKDNSNKFAYIPAYVWYTPELTTNDMLYAPFAISAIDGSIIRFWFSGNYFYMDYIY